MPDFAVDIGIQNEMPDARLHFAPQRWSAEAVGGARRARVLVSGPRDAFESLPRHLGEDITIYSELGQAVWSGYIHEIEIRDGDQSAVLSMDNIYNRVAVAYTTYGASGGEERQTTDWADDLRSQERYQVRELLLSADADSQTTAEALRDAVLAQHAQPLPQLKSEGSDQGTGATLYCRGKAEWLKHIYYDQPNGLEENVETRSGEIAVGGHYTASTISFAVQDDINDSANGLGDMQQGEQMVISGATNPENNGVFTVATYDTAGHIEVTSKDLVNELAGNPITIAHDAYGATRLDQVFQLATTTDWHARYVAIRAYKDGSPGDNLRVRIYDDLAGEPDTLLSTATIAGSAIPAAGGWVEFTLPSALTLSAATDYHLVVSRTGSADFGDHYIVELDEDLSYSRGAMRIEQDGSWQTRSPDADLLFRITGEDDTMHQAIQLLTDTGLYDGIDESTADSGILTWQYRDGDRTAYAELAALLGNGTSGGDRLYYSVTSDNRVRIAVRPSESATDPVLLTNGHIEGADPGQMIAGGWVKVGNALMAAMLGQESVFVEECEFDAVSGKLSIVTESSPDARDAVSG